MRKIWICIILTLALLLTACTGGKNSPEKPTDTPNSGKFGQESTQTADSGQEASGQTDPTKPNSNSSQTESSKPSNESSKPSENSKPQESDDDDDSQGEDLSGLPEFLQVATADQRAAYFRAFELYTNGYYSYVGLIDRMENEGYVYEDAVWAVDRIDADWYVDAVGYANYLLSQDNYTRGELWSDLSYAYFTDDQCDYGVANCSADWSYEALQMANSYLYEYAPCAPYDLKMQFMDGGWTQDEIDYAMENCIADFDYYALLRAQDIVGSMGISESTLQYALSMEGYYNDQIDYAVQYCGADWDYEATEVATDYVSDFPDCTHDELYLVLVSNFGFSDYQASQGCANVGK
ncbi:MAG: hypothetical protein IJM83_05945 [Firmicutes bacterium]|nr:hypothetical protein [Bacillota bacterium]